MSVPALSTTQRNSIIESLTRLDAAFQSHLDRMTPDEEIRERAKIAKLVMGACVPLRHQGLLQIAVQHLEAILVRLEHESPDRAAHTDALSQARMEEFLMTGSLEALDKAVELDRQAIDSARVTGLQDREPDAYLEILHHSSFSLSRRSHVSGDINDLDEAIRHSRTVYHIAPRGSTRSQLALNNLASQLRRRFDLDKDDTYLRESEELMRALLSCTTPGTAEHAVAKGQLFHSLYRKCMDTQSLEAIDEAIGHGKAAFEGLPKGSDAETDLLNMMVDIFARRHNLTSNESDFREFVDYSGSLLGAIPESHPSRGSSLVDYLKRVGEYASADLGLESLERAIDQAEMGLSAMPADFPQREFCRYMISNLLGTRYSASNSLSHLSALIDYVESMVVEHNERARLSEPAGPQVESNWISIFKGQLKRLAWAPVDNEMRISAERELAGLSLSYRLHDPRTAAASILEDLNRDHGQRLDVIIQAIESGQLLSDKDIDVEVERIKKKEVAAGKAREGSWKPTDVEFLEALDRQRKQMLGPKYGRTLAMDPTSQSPMVSMPGLIQEQLGYDPTKPLPRDQFMAREKQTERRFIDKARSRGRHPNLGLCYTCRELAKPLGRAEAGFWFAPSLLYPAFGNFFQLVCRSHCAICRLISSAVTTVSGNLLPQLKAIDPEVQGIRLCTGVISTGEKVLRVDYGMKPVTELRIITPANYHQAIRQSWEDTGAVQFEKAYECRKGPPWDQDSQMVGLEKLKTWLNDCEEKHGSACDQSHSGERAKNQMPMNFIDVSAECLVARTSHERFYALSYVWGQVEMCKTMKDNYEARQVPGALSTVQFPKTIRDAISLVRSLGGRYLWVDAVCLVQDDTEQMARDVPNMDIVYGKAFATIVALHGDSADAGLPGIRPGSRPPQQIESLQVSKALPELDWDPGCEQNEQIYLTATPRPLHLALQDSKWNKRGWILQERLLSRRCLYFSAHSVYFQCSQETLTEFGINEQYKAFMYDKYATNDEDLIRAADLNKPMRGIDFHAGPGAEERTRRAFGVYRQLVEIYSRRELSFKSDVLNGFAGIFAVLGEHLQSGNDFGLPAAFFSHALLWAPSARLPRRGCRLPTRDDLRMGKPDPQFPSWSWAAWDGPIDFRLLGEADGSAPLPTPLVKVFRIGKGPLAHEVRAGIDPSIAKDRRSKHDEECGGSTEKPAAESMAEECGRRDRDNGPVGSISDSQPADENRVDEKPQEAGANTLSDMAENKTTQTLRDTPTATDDVPDKHAQSASSPEDCKQDPSADAGSEVPKPQGGCPRTVPVRVLPDKHRGSSWAVSGPQAGVQEPLGPAPANTILRFSAPTLPLGLFAIAREKEYISEQAHVHVRSPQAVRRISDRHGKQCGLLWEQAGYGWVGLGLDQDSEEGINLVGVSRYYDVATSRGGGLPCVEGEISVFDKKAFPAEGPSCGLVNVLVVDYDVNRPESAGYRCTVAVIHSAAWERAGPVERVIQLR